MTMSKGSTGSTVRCPWAEGAPEYLPYHDEEWGRPVAEDARVYEKLCLEGFQSGLSWLTILRKREAFRRAFAGFDPDEVASYGETDVERLMADASIVRHRAKILAAIDNARAVVALHGEGVSLAGLVWSHEPARQPAPRTLADVPGSTKESAELSGELRRLGFRFVGPTTAYASMQSLGVVNDHLASCSFRAPVEEDRSRFTRPVVGGGGLKGGGR